ncbi:MAG: 2-C-methyl-D-erythritol 4-phosphate cytidylyltransferase [Flexistipes sinusarabici]|uniref:2-C-methyl-D-erythritol 4-phosphate cytidylyltransferase n=1 Tax=Flexistipes sinusarabici TaxID=2352 RepID=A0A5D0MNA7_FLESI|nr:IspD/TarI family cytidylyltransferase [Flexistipes sinusarabici]TYB34486.1 MAG: 2-C-methyl-D-erythritol 4-phosphate cytidylyltransferase [Flexistipes sinusarabici]
MKKSISAIVPAGGIGKRFTVEGKKQFFSLNGRPIIYYTLAALMGAYKFDQVIIGAAPEDFTELENICESLNINNYLLSEKGEERSNTVYNALGYCSSDYVLIHDSVRPCVDKQVVYNTIQRVFEKDAVICGVRPSDTVKLLEGSKISHTLERERLLLTHTPQCFSKKLILEGLRYVFQNDLSVTDDSSAVEVLGHQVEVVPSNAENIKVTKYSDIYFLKEYLSNKFVD